MTTHCVDDTVHALTVCHVVRAVFLAAGKGLAITLPLNADAKAGATARVAKPQPFEFDTVMGPHTNQHEMFEVPCLPLVSMSCLLSRLPYALHQR